MAAGPHVLALPFPAQGHVIPLMQLSHRLVEHGVEVTFVNTEAVHELVLDAMPPADDGTGRPSLDGIHLVGIPDGLADGDDRKDLGKLVAALSRHLPGYLEKLVRRVEASGGTKISWLIADQAMAGWAFGVAKKLGIRVACFWPGSVAFLDTIFRVPQWIKDGVIDDKGAELAKATGDIADRPRDAAAAHVASVVEQRRRAGGPTGHLGDDPPEQRGERPRRGLRLQLVPRRRAGRVRAVPGHPARRPPVRRPGVQEAGGAVPARGRRVPRVARRAPRPLRCVRGVRQLHRLQPAPVRGARAGAGAHRLPVPVGGAPRLRRRPEQGVARRVPAPCRRLVQDRELVPPAAGAGSPCGGVLRVALRVELDAGRGAERCAVPVLAILHGPVPERGLHLRRVGGRLASGAGRGRRRDQGGAEQQSGASPRRRRD